MGSVTGNVTLIGMPGAGKSTVGVILAKNLGLGFIDTDVLIQINQQRTLQQIMDAEGYLRVRAIEEVEILKINISRHVIATGGSAVYSPTAMAHLQRMSTVIFLNVDYEVAQHRIHDFATRGIAKAPGQTFRELFNERQELYRHYARLTIDGNGLDQDRLAAHIAHRLNSTRSIHPFAGSGSELMNS